MPYRDWSMSHTILEPNSRISINSGSFLGSGGVKLPPLICVLSLSSCQSTHPQYFFILCSVLIHKAVEEKMMTQLGALGLSQHKCFLESLPNFNVTMSHYKVFIGRNTIKWAKGAI